MKHFKADLHMHTVLSPCGSLEMSPVMIVEKALEKELDIIGITDHNSTRQCREVYKVGQQKGLTVICGAEVTTKEEVHCLTLFENFAKLEIFQTYLDQHLPNIPNDPERFGYQVWVDENEEICGTEDRLLISALDQSIDEVAAKVRELHGIFIPAHVFRPRYSLFSQLGFMPFDLQPDAIGISPSTHLEDQMKQHPELSGYTVIRSSDAHFPDQIGTRHTVMAMEEPTFIELRMALAGQDGRKVVELV